MKKLLSLLLVLVLAMSIVGCSNDETPTEPTEETETDETKEEESEDLSEKPFEGETLSVLLAYGGAEDSFDKFTEETGIKVEYVEMSTGEALAKLEAEEGKTTADIWFGGGVDSYINARNLDYLEPYKSDELSHIDEQYCDEDGNYSGLALVPAGFIVNEDILEEKGLDTPKTWEDLADPQYKSEIIMANPAISGTNYAIVSGLIQSMGEEEAWDYFEKLNENIDFYAKGGGEPLQKVGAGEFGIGIVAITGGTYEVGESNPTEVIYPEDIIPWTPAPIAIFKNTEKLDASKVFVDWYLSQEGQTVLRDADARIMARDDVDAPEEMKDLDQDKLIDFDLELMGSERTAILEKWEALIGDK